MPISHSPTRTDILRIGGAFVAAFSLAVVLLCLFVLPDACTPSADFS